MNGDKKTGSDNNHKDVRQYEETMHNGVMYALTYRSTWGRTARTTSVRPDAN